MRNTSVPIDFQKNFNFVANIIKIIDLDAKRDTITVTFEANRYKCRDLRRQGSQVQKNKMY